jgi:hypothetical protein
MGLLEQITRMRKEGLNDNDISSTLQEQKISPAAINDAFNQLKVKEAVSAEDSYPAPTPKQTQKNMANQGQFYTPRTKDIDEAPQAPTPDQNQDYYSPQNYNPPTPDSYPGQNTQEEYYPQYNYDDSQQQGSYATDTDTIIEIAEQVFSEKTKQIQKQVDMLNEFATLAENKLENNLERIKRIEKIIDNLQIKILEKVGSYGENLDSVKKEMNMMQESFSKVLPELAEAKKSSHKTEHKK